MSPASLLLTLLLLSSQAAAQETRRELPASPDAVATADALTKKQTRREGLRETLKRPVDELPSGVRQLSPQEKTEMRQLLRQQFDPPK